MDKKYHSNEEMIERAEAHLRLAEEMGYRTIISKVHTRIQELEEALEFTKVESDVRINKGKTYYYMQLQRINERAAEALKEK